VLLLAVGEGERITGSWPFDNYPGAEEPSKTEDVLSLKQNMYFVG